ncbi:MAG: aspartate/glutamate racemase family protein [Melioribacteraceae bacterium]|nr:aspartate/glutamate racemase family protein [Melioribacteraceae bacterium]
MKKTKYLYSLLAILLLANYQLSAPQKSFDELLSEFFKKENVKIVVTDSGLGGVSVAADVVSRMKNSGVFKNVEIIFFNSQPHKKSGYNSMKTTEQKVEVFNNALEAMQKHFQPDMLLIACNTLSVIYDYTKFSKTVKFPVVGIVETGIDLINEKLEKDPNSNVIIFATKTTVKQGQHKKGLLELGINKNNIYVEACPKLAGRIERGPDSDTTKSLVNIYVKEAMQKYENTGEPLYVSYNCTHYGYVDTLFKKAFKAHGVEVKEFLDPNPLMADFMFTKNLLNRFKNTEVSVKIVSQPELSPGKLGAIYGLIEPISDETAEALMEYEFTPDYFEWESIANRE